MTDDRTPLSSVNSDEGWNLLELEGVLHDSLNDKPRKPISIRLPIEDLERAKALASQRKIGYQTLLCLVIHEGLKQLEARYRLERLGDHVPGVKLAREIGASQAVEVLRALARSSSARVMQELTASPAFRVAEAMLVQAPEATETPAAPPNDAVSPAEFRELLRAVEDIRGAMKRSGMLD